VAAAAANLATTIGASAILVDTSSGVTAARVVRQRPDVPVLAFHAGRGRGGRMALLWGACSACSKVMGSYEEMVDHARVQAVAESFAERGGRILVVAGIPFGQSGTTNNLRVVDI
jgi:pyruvate kinase